MKLLQRRVLPLVLLAPTTTDVSAWEEAILSYVSPAQLRNIFFLLVSEGSPAFELYELFRAGIWEDHLINGLKTKIEALNALLTKFDSQCKSLADHGLSSPQCKPTLLTQEKDRFDLDERDKNAKLFEATMNQEHKLSRNYTLEKLMNGNGGVIYPNARAGTENIRTESFNILITPVFLKLYRNCWQQNRLKRRQRPHFLTFNTNYRFNRRTDRVRLSSFFTRSKHYQGPRYYQCA